MQTITMKVDKNIHNQYFDDYVNSIDMWCAANCSGDYTIDVSEAPTYNFPTKISVDFVDESDATYFKLCPLWADLIGG